MSEFEIAIGGLTSIPVVGGLIFLGYKSLGEGSLDTSKLKPKKRQQTQREHPHLTRKNASLESVTLMRSEAKMNVKLAALIIEKWCKVLIQRNALSSNANMININMLQGK